MRTYLRSKVTLLFLAFAVAIFAVSGAAMALTTDTSGTTSLSPTITSDKADYAPGELVTLTGGNWQPGETVNIKVNDTYGATWSRNVDVTADASGNVTDSFNLPNTFVSNYDVTATGAQSGTATTTFTDKDNTTDSLSASPDPAVRGASVTYTATYVGNASAGKPTGTVDFRDTTTGTDLCTNVNLTNPGGPNSVTGTASCTVTLPTTSPLGSHQIQARWGGNSNYNSSNQTITTSVNPRPPTGLTATANGQNTIDLNWTASPDSANITSYVVFEGTTAVKTVTPNTATSTSITGLTAGSTHTYTVKARYTDTAPNPDVNYDSAASGSATATTASADSTSPDTSITASPNNPTNSTSASFSFTGTDNVTSPANLTFECSLDGAAFTSCTSPKVFSNLGAGSHTFQVRAKDAAGNVDGSPASYTWTVDTAAPAKPGTPDLDANSDTGSSSTDNITSDNTPTFNGTAEANSTVKVYVDGVEKGSGTASGGSYSITTSSLGDGSHSIKVTATDAAGNTSVDSDTLSVTIDTAKPNAPTRVDLVAASDTGTSSTDNITSDNTPTFDVDAENNSTVKIFKGNDATALGSAQANGSGLANVTSSQLVDGTYQISATATDAAGNVSDSSTTINVQVGVTVDTAAPNAPTGLDLDANSDSGSSSTDNITNDNTPTINGSAEAFSTVELFEGSTSLGSATADAQGAWSITSSQLGEGAHSLTAKATDAAGNTSVASNAFSVTIDTQAPNAPTRVDLVAASDTGTSSTDNVTQDTTPTFDVDAEAGSTVKVYKDNDATALGSAQANGSGLASVTSSTLADGSYTISADATDVAGNVSANSATINVTVDLNVDTAAPAKPGTPDLDSNSDSGSSNTDDITSDNTPTFNGTAEANSTVKVYVDGVEKGSGTATGGSYSITTSALGEGQHSIKVTATDAAGNVSVDSDTLGVTIDTQAPNAPTRVDLVAGSDTGTSSTDNVTQDTTPTFDVDAEAGSTVKIFKGNDATALGSALANGSGLANVTSSTLVDGTYTISADATDVAGNVSANSATINVTVDLNVDTAAPAAPTGLSLDANSNSGSQSDNTTNDNTPTINGSAEANSSVELFEGSTSLGTVQANAQGAWSITSSQLSDGAHSLTAKATDAAGNTSSASGALSVTIDTAIATPAAPDLVAASDTGTSSSDNITNDNTPTFNGSAEAGSSVSVLVDGVEKGSGTATGGSYSITTSALGDGAHTVKVKATDAAGNVSSESTGLSVTIDTTAPVITLNVSSSTVSNGGVYYFGSVPPAPTCSANDSSACTVSGYSTAVGSQTLTGTATDVAGNTGTAQLSYQVKGWTPGGFYQPVDMTPANATSPLYNTVKNGSTVPMKFEVFAGATELTDVGTTIGTPGTTGSISDVKVAKVACDGSAGEDAIETTTTGATTLRYDTTGGQFIFNWQTPKGASQVNQCYKVTVPTKDGSSISAYFKLK